MLSPQWDEKVAGDVEVDPAIGRNGSSSGSREAELTAALDHERNLSRQLQQALETRVVIEQAKGFIAASRSVDLDEAFQLLRAYSRSHSRKIHDVARAVVQRRLFL